jgi:glycosyltransferase involved in cell wall biosynthesis
LFEPLKAEVARRGLASAHFKPYQPREQLAQGLSAADVHLVSLRPELEGLIVPSKFYGICAAGRPTLFIGDGDGEISRMAQHHKCGRVVPVGDGIALAQIINELAAGSAACRRMGRRARQAFEAEFDKSIAIARWDELLLQALGDRVFTVHGEARAGADCGKHQSTASDAEIRGDWVSPRL